MRIKSLTAVPLSLGILLTPLTTGQCEEAKPPTVPFQIERDKIIIPTVVNGSKPLRLILDTGMGFDGVYLFHKDALKLIDTTGAIEVRVPGAGSGEASKATMIETGSVDFGDVSLDSQRVIVSHSKHTQTFPTDGIIGWSLFGHYAVDIDYDQSVIHLRDTAYVPQDSSWTRVPVTMEGTLPFFDAEVEVVKGEKTPIRVYIDLASGEALELLAGSDQKFSMPDSMTESYLATGLSGDIHGGRGRAARMQVSGFSLSDVPCTFAPATVRSKQQGADAVLGNGLIRRFNVIFAYSQRCLYVKPNQTFQTPFE
jgi:hypothetical protein